MIENDHQYRVTLGQANRFKQALANLDGGAIQPPFVEPILIKAHRDGLQSQYDELQAELAVYRESRPKYAYFARSLRGGKVVDPAALHKAVVAAIRQGGYKPQFELPVTLDRRVYANRDSYVYYRDLRWISECQVMIAEVSAASHGVGYELCYADLLCHLPILCVAEKEATISAMITGYYPVVLYRDYSDMTACILEFLARHKEFEP